MAGRLMGVACTTLGVALGIRGVPDWWLCWLLRTDMGTGMPWLGATDAGRGGLPAAAPRLGFAMATIGDAISDGTICLTTGDACAPWAANRCACCGTLDAIRGVDIGLAFALLVLDRRLLLPTARCGFACAR
jgi:hypothetical protein